MDVGVRVAAAARTLHLAVSTWRSCLLCGLLLRLRSHSRASSLGAGTMAEKGNLRRVVGAGVACVQHVTR